MPLYDAYGRVIELAPELEDSWEPSQYQVGMATAYAKGVAKLGSAYGYRYADGVKVQLNLGSLNGCGRCSELSGITIMAAKTWNRVTLAHLASEEHLNHVLGVGSIQEAVKVLQASMAKPDDGLAVDDSAEPSYGWRGFHLEVEAERVSAPEWLGVPSVWDYKVRMKGANNRYWDEGKMAGVCTKTQGSWESQRSACLRHLEYVPGRGEELRFETEGKEVRVYEVSQKRCMCGIYGYSTFEGLRQHMSGDKFSIMAFVAGYGTVNEDIERNFKASDVKVVKLFIMEKKFLEKMTGLTLGFSRQELERSQTKEYANGWLRHEVRVSYSYDREGVMEAVGKKFGCPVEMVWDEVELSQLLDEKEQQRQMGGVEVPEWMDFTKRKEG